MSGFGKCAIRTHSSSCPTSSRQTRLPRKQPRDCSRPTPCRSRQSRGRRRRRSPAWFAGNATSPQWLGRNPWKAGKGNSPGDRSCLSRWAKANRPCTLFWGGGLGLGFRWGDARSMVREGAVRKGGRVMVERMKRKINRPRVSSEKCSDEFRPSVASSGWSTRTLPTKGSNQVRTRHVPAVWVRVCGPSGDVFPLCFAQETRDRRRVAAASDGIHPRPGAIQKPPGRSQTTRKRA